ncbi:RNA-directed DNA polymerase [Colwellia sp. BRX8-2]|uniref:retron St85 family RNA-directed DNA polymerase n=2 Tax=Colwellia TaxID=28228 RepID=UPI0015F5F646|nr:MULTISPECIES: retron St85 family RNA-directed DNA polymerase [unclassified Colwellia]MBA6353544.1 RNA-directed DNA polymerase [Colwellia sp. BRX9-1]MBA6361977.1 RNA-directed DNA polymerase [Colwellia sp. BRX8-6]MBA6369068.1 RNA-directed DNA polymerase [Colwellia sp. BRX8-5]MBA6377343.1 RNA-directed DNA polymerase [Colwellia sp. BRX8-2]
MGVIDKLANKLNFTKKDVAFFLFDAPKKYKVYNIPKRSFGHRVIAQPSKELKEYQRTFLELYQFPHHANSMAYSSGKSIKDNAEVHRKQRYLLKMDLENFFNSITPEVFWNAWGKFKALPDDNDKEWIERLLFWQPRSTRSNDLKLSVGAPSSPSISNFCMYLFDEVVTEHCQKESVYYTRYADDLTFSTNKKDILSSIPSVIKTKLKECFDHRLVINQRKTKFSSKAHNRHVTGITISNDEKLSLGRERKRYIKHLVHQFQLNKLDQKDIRHLQGLIAFARHIEPMFISSLTKKYSETLIQRIIEAHNE